MKRPTLLLVEDERSIQESLYEAFCDDYTVLATSSGEEAVEIIRKHEVNCVILDLILPGYDGLRTLRILKSIDRKLPVVIISGTKTVGMVIQCFRSGAHDFLDKPFSLQHLRQTLSKARAAAACLPAGGNTLPVDMEQLIEREVENSLRQNAALNSALACFRERYIDYVEEKVMHTAGYECAG